MPVTEATRIDRESNQWDEGFYAFLAEKELRSGSLRTVQSYSRMLQHFFAELGKSPVALTGPAMPLPRNTLQMMLKRKIDSK